MTQRKPPGVRFETWIEKQIREATERGEFDDLPGSGRRLEDLGDEHDEDWWIKQKLRRENIVVLPASLLLRKEAEETLIAAVRARTPEDARALVEAVNEKILEGIRKPIEGPPLNLSPFDVDEVLAQWHEHHPPSAAPAVAGPVAAARKRRLRDRFRR